MTTKWRDSSAQGALGRPAVSRRNFCGAESLAKRYGETCHLDHDKTPSKNHLFLATKKKLSPTSFRRSAVRTPPPSERIDIELPLRSEPPFAGVSLLWAPKSQKSLKKSRGGVCRKVPQNARKRLKIEGSCFTCSWSFFAHS